MRLTVLASRSRSRASEAYDTVDPTRFGYNSLDFVQGTYQFDWAHANAIVVETQSGRTGGTYGRAIGQS